MKKAIGVSMLSVFLLFVGWAGYVYHVLGFGIEGGFFPYVFRHTPFLPWAVFVFCISYAAVQYTASKKPRHC